MRNGRIFNDPELATYFSSKSWYEGTISPDAFSEESLSKIEKTNIERIKVEESRW
ncbi:MAG: YARHG domain-containing protein [Firmicutes bacterium]|nr:YARHG domain-containing protein [Bacillota bacterium]